MAPSFASLPEKGIQLVDLPGHPRLRSHLLAQHLSSSSGVVFFIDPNSNGNAQGIQTTAEHLHVVLSLLRILEKRSNGKKRVPKLLLLLTKSDTWTAIQRQRVEDRIRSSLGRELEKRRKMTLGAAAPQARLESIEELPSESSSNPLAFLGYFSRLSRSSTSRVAIGGFKLPDDEQEILQSDVLNYDGSFSWEDKKLGISISWTTASCKRLAMASEGSIKEKQSTSLTENEEDGTAGFYSWVREI